MARLRERGEDLSIILVGKVEYPYPDVEALFAEAGMAGAAVHAGYLPDRDLRALYREARALAYPSLYEGFGLPVLEAMARGVPTVTTRRGAIPEVGGDAVLYFEAEDVDSLAQAMASLADDAELREDLGEIEAAESRTSGRRE